MTNESLGNRLGTADRHLISVIGDQVNYNPYSKFINNLLLFISKIIIL